MQKNVKVLAIKRRENVIMKLNEATSILSTFFAVGEFVLVHQAVDRFHKLPFSWIGLFRITAIHDPLFYSITSLSDSNSERVHTARLIKYVESLNGTEVLHALLDLADKNGSRYKVVEKIIDLGEAEGGLFFRLCGKESPKNAARHGKSQKFSTPTFPKRSSRSSPKTRRRTSSTISSTSEESLYEYFRLIHTRVLTGVALNAAATYREYCEQTPRLEYFAHPHHVFGVKFVEDRFAFRQTRGSKTNRLAH